VDLTKLSTRRLLEMLKKVRKLYFKPFNYEYDEVNIYEEEYTRIKEELAKREHIESK